LSQFEGFFKHVQVVLNGTRLVLNEARKKNNELSKGVLLWAAAAPISNAGNTIQRKKVEGGE
jgi:hypothetical protein